MNKEFDSYQKLATSPFTSEDQPKQVIDGCRQFEAWQLGPNHWRNLALRRWRIEAVIALLDAGMEKSNDRLKSLLSKQLEIDEFVYPRNHNERLVIMQTYLACELGPLPPKWAAEYQRLKDIYSTQTIVQQ